MLFWEEHSLDFKPELRWCRRSPLIRRFVPVTTQLTGFRERPNITAISTPKRLLFL